MCRREPCKPGPAKEQGTGAFGAGSAGVAGVDVSGDKGLSEGSPGGDFIALRAINTTAALSAPRDDTARGARAAETGPKTNSIGHGEQRGQCSFSFRHKLQMPFASDEAPIWRGVFLVPG